MLLNVLFVAIFQLELLTVLEYGQFGDEVGDFDFWVGSQSVEFVEGVFELGLFDVEGDQIEGLFGLALQDGHYFEGSEAAELAEEEGEQPAAKQLQLIVLHLIGKIFEYNRVLLFFHASLLGRTHQKEGLGQQIPEFVGVERFSEDDSHSVEQHN